MNIRHLITLPMLAILSACTTTSDSSGAAKCCADSVDIEWQHAKIIESCTATANRYPYSRDRLLYDEYGALFTEDAVFQIEGGLEVIGRPAIVQALRERGATAITRHVSHVVSIETNDDTTASGISYVTIWRADARSMQAGDNTVASPFVVGEYHDEFKIQDQRCLISKRLVRIVFQGVTQSE